MIRKLLAILLCVELMLLAPAGAQQSPAQLQAQVQALPWTNGKGIITGANLQQQYLGIIATLGMTGSWGLNGYVPNLSNVGGNCTGTATGILTCVQNLGQLIYLAPFAGAVGILQSQKNAQTTNIDEGGAAGDGKTDDTAALARSAANFAGGTGGKVLLSCAKNYYFNSPINLAQNYPGVVIQGCLSPPDDSSISQGGTAHTEFGQNGRIIFGPNFQATIGASTGFQDAMMTAQGCTFPAQTPSCYAGTPIVTAAGNGNYAILHRVMIIGAAECLNDAAGSGRLDIRDFRCDGINGEVIGPSLDTTVLEDIHNYPYGTAAASGGTNTRTGNGLVLTGAGPGGTNPSGSCDDTRLTGYFDFGHTNGFLGQCNGNVWLGGRMWLDNNGGVALEIDGSTHMQGPGSLYIATCGVCLKITGQTDLQIGNANIFAASSDCINIDGTFVASSIIMGQCGGNGVTMSNRSYFETPFLKQSAVTGTYVCPAAGTNINQIAIGVSINDLGFGNPLIGCNNISLPVLTSATELPIPSTGGTVSPPAFYVLASSTPANNQISTFQGSWGGREIVLDIAQGVSILSSPTIKLKNGAGSLAGPATYAFRLDNTTVTWQQEW